MIKRPFDRNKLFLTNLLICALLRLILRSSVAPIIMGDTQNDNQQSPSNSDGKIIISSIKPPPFMYKNPTLWLQLMESAFNVHQPPITREQTKYDHVITALPPEVAEEISDVITKKAEYSELKEALINRFTESAKQRLEKLLISEELGDRKPSQLLRRLQQLSIGDNKVSDVILQSLWLQRLPKNVQQVLQVSTAKLDELALLADKMMDVDRSEISEVKRIQPQSTVNSVSSGNDVSDVLQKLTLEIGELRKSFENRGHNRFRSRSRSRPPSRSNSPRRQEYEFCWYHYKFGKEAKKCRDPCKWKEKN